MSTGTQKIAATHLSRQAYLYVRQSTLRQVLENTESTKRQYALEERAVALGWKPEQVVVIDSDLGQSGADADRAGFQQLVAAVGMGEVGVVIGLEVSRLARNSSDWHRLLEICALSDTLILDEDGLYDPSHFNDRLLLGMKGTMSEAELHVLKARLIGGQLAKARRGELEVPLPVGLVYDAAGRVVLDPDLSVQSATRSVLRDLPAHRVGDRHGAQPSRAGLALSPPGPVRAPQRRAVVGGAAALSGPQRVEEPSLCRGFRLWTHPGQEGRPTEWVAPAPSPGTVAHPDPRRPSRLHHLGRARGEPGPAAGELRRLWETTGGTDRPERASPAPGPGGLRTLRWTDDDPLLQRATASSCPNTACQSEGIKRAEAPCQRVLGGDVDRAIGELLVESMTPLTLEVALSVQDELAARADEADRLRRQQVERARYEAELAQRRYLRVDPDNRLVATTLEAEWNNKLRALDAAQDDYQRQREADVLLDDEKRRPHPGARHRLPAALERSADPSA